MEKYFWKYSLQTKQRLINNKHEIKESNLTKISSIFYIKKELFKNQRLIRSKTKYKRLYYIANILSYYPVKNDWGITSNFGLQIIDLNRSKSQRTTWTINIKANPKNDLLSN